MENIIINGSARANSNTLREINKLSPFKDYEHIKLKDRNISHYSYENAYLIAQGTDSNMPQGFEVPFRKTAEYLEMTFVESKYISSKELLDG